MPTVEDRLKGAPPRLIILAACAFARTVEHLLKDQRSRDAIDVAERFADGNATEAEIRAASRAGLGTASGAPMESISAWASAWAAVELAARGTRELEWVERAAWAATRADARAHAAHNSILDCILTRRIPLSGPSHVSGLANKIYDIRDWALMPILADALDDIDQHDMAVHCRQPFHAKGCYVLDSIMGRS